MALLRSNQALEERLAQVSRQLEWLKRQLFGRKSEKRLIDVSPDQLSLAYQADVSQAQESGPTQEVAGYRRRGGAKQKLEGAVNESGLRFDESVPVEVIEVPNPGVAGLDPDRYEVIGEKTTHRLAQRPGSYVVLAYRRVVVKLKDEDKLRCPPAPANVLDKSYADVSFMAGLLIDKFVYHLPLYRLHQRLRDAGIQLSRGGITGLVQRTCALLEPIYQAQLVSILEGSLAAMDETPVKAGRKGKGQMKTGYFWPIYGEHDEVVFPYHASRGSGVVKQLLGDFKGTLITDGYAAYERYSRLLGHITHAQCWAHARRGFAKAEEAEPQRAAKALEFIGELYAHEAQARERRPGDPDKLAHRVAHSRPVVEAFFTWLEDEVHDTALLPSNPFTEAAHYVLKRREGLRVFLADPRVPLDTNHLERTLRAIPLGRKNWMFCWTEVGAEHVGIAQSLLVSCRLQGINPYTYLVDVLQRIASHPAKDVHLLTPRLWKDHFSADPLRSDIDPRRQ